MTKVDRADPADCQRLLAMLEPPLGRRGQAKRKRPLAKVVDRAPGSGRRSAGEHATHHRASGPDRVTHDPGCAGSCMPDSDEPSARARRRHLIQFMMKAPIRLLCGCQRSLRVFEDFAEALPQRVGARARIIHGMRITRIRRIVHGTRITPMGIGHGRRIASIIQKADSGARAGPRPDADPWDHPRVLLMSRGFRTSRGFWISMRRCRSTAPVTAGCRS